MIAALPGADLDDRRRSADLSPQDFAFVDRQRQRFFAIDIFSRSRRIDQHFRVPVIGHTDQHDIDIFAGQ